MKMEPIMQIGKATITPELTESVEQALEARELIKINVLKNCVAMPGDVAALLAERTHSDVVQVIGRKIVLYRESKTKKKLNCQRQKYKGVGKRMKIGIMGGTFNPIHNAHLMMAQAAYEQYKLDEIWFMPSAKPPHKNQDEIAEKEHRKRMVQFAIDKTPYLNIQILNIKEKGKHTRMTHL